MHVGTSPSASTIPGGPPVTTAAAQSAQSAQATRRGGVGELLARVQSMPFVPFFGLGVLFGWLGVSPWIFYAVGWTEVYSGTQHATLQLQCFELAFAAGFLFTAIPRRTGSPPPSFLTLGLAAGSLLFTAGVSLAGRPQLASLGYLATLIVLLTFAIGRFTAAGGLGTRRPPPTFILLPIGFFFGIVGAFATSGLFEVPLAVIELGYDLIRQGVFFCLILGVGGMLLPLVLGYPPPKDVTRETWTKVVPPALLGLMIGATFVIEHGFGLRVASMSRGALVLTGLILFAGIHRRPRVPGLQRWVVLISAWCVPIGALCAGFAPDYRIAFLHITFIGGFGLMTFAVASHVVLGHTEREHLRDAVRWPVIIYAFLMLLAATTRVTSDFLLDDYFQHLAYAASVWIVDSLVWAWLMLKPAPATPGRA